MRTARSGLVLVIALLAFSGIGRAQGPASTSTLIVKTISGHSLTFGPQDFSKLPLVRVSATDHDGKKHEYEGVNLRDLLDQVGTPHNDELRGKEMSDYVLAEASDGYRVIFSLAELDPNFGDIQVVVADKIDGQPLGAHDGPLRLVVPGDKRQARWIRMLTSITVARAQ